MSQDLVQICTVGKIWYANTNMLTSLTGDVLNAQFGESVNTQRSITLFKGHPNAKYDPGNVRGEYYGESFYSPVNPTLGGVMGVLDSSAKSRPGAGMLIVDNCYDYMQITLSFPEIFEGIKSLGYDLTFRQFEDPKFAELRKTIKKMPLAGTDDLYARLKEDRQWIAAHSDDVNLIRQIKESSGRTLSRIKAQVKRNIEFMPQWIINREAEYHWPRN